MLKALLYLLFFFLPTQLGKHFWFDWSYKLGMRVDYLSPTVYLTDIFIFLIIVLFFFENSTPGVKEKSPPQGWWGKLVTGGWLLAAGCWWLVAVGENPWLLIYNLGRLGILGLLGYVIAKTFKKEDFPQIIKVLNWALILQVFLAGYQVIVEKSADLWILGERSFSIGTPGIARFTAPGGSLLLRGYGTFSHPNVLGGFCLLMLVGNGVMFLKTDNRRQRTDIEDRGQKGESKKSVLGFPSSVFYIAGFIFSLLGIWLSMSLLAIVLSQVFLLGLVLLIRRCLTRRTGTKTVLLRGQPQGLPLQLFLLVIPIIILVVGIWYLRPEADRSWAGVAGNSDSITRRVVLLKYSWEMFRTSPIFGVGLGNFVPAMPEKPVGQTYFWQPVHNMPVLIGVELGLVSMAGVMLLIWLGIKKFKVTVKNLKLSKNSIIYNSYFIILVFWWLIIFITGMFDHYWLTLQQGRLMLVVVIGLTFVGASNSKKAKK